MDLKQQLVIWKRAAWLQANIALTPLLYDRLVEEGIFTSSMMTKVQVSLLIFHGLIKKQKQINMTSSVIREGFI